jgi:glycerophosphoryl diester phosphodiesterase
MPNNSYYTIWSSGGSPHNDFSGVPVRKTGRVRIAVDNLVREKKRMPQTEFVTFSLEAGKELIRLAPEADVYYLNGNLPPADPKAPGFAGPDYAYDKMKEHPERLGMS